MLEEIWIWNILRENRSCAVAIMEDGMTPGGDRTMQYQLAGRDTIELLNRFKQWNIVNVYFIFVVSSLTQCFVNNSL